MLDECPFGIPDTNDVDHMFQLLVAHKFLRTPRDILRLFNSLSVSMAGIAENVHFMDFVCLEVLRLFHPKIYQAIRDNRNAFLHANEQRPALQDNRFVGFHDKLLESMPENEQEGMKRILFYLFPNLETFMWRTSGTDERSKRDRRIHSSKHFDTYFTSSVSPYTVPKSEIDFLLDPSRSKNDIRKEFEKAFGVTQPNDYPKVLMLA